MSTKKALRILQTCYDQEQICDLTSVFFYIFLTVHCDIPT